MRRTSHLLGLVAALAASISCGDVVRQGRAPVMLVIDSLQASAGGSGTPSGFLLSDVATATPDPPCSAKTPCVFNDAGSAQLRLTLKDVGTPSSPATPSPNNDVTITRIHIKYVRSDGRNVQGVDIPYEWDSAATFTVAVGSLKTIPFELVRHVAKEESPLVQLR